MNDFAQIEWNEAVADDCRQLVRLAAREDLDRGQDWTTVSLVPAEAMSSASIVARDAGVICGLRAAEIVIEQMDARLGLEIIEPDGSAVTAGSTVAVLSGPARSMLTVERPLLNFVGHLSGIATLASKYLSEIADTKARIYDTRKTLPGWRRLEKYAVRCGGGTNHRTGLYDAVLIKDNHLAFGTQNSDQSRFTTGEAVERAREFLQSLPENLAMRQAIVEVEVDSIDQLKVVLPTRPDVVLLDNMKPEQLRACIALRDKVAPEVELEASGGVNLQTVRAIAETGIDRISVAPLTHSATWFDVGLDWAV